MRFAYADPPYLGRASRLYPDDEPIDTPEAHAALIAELEAGYDGWALSASSSSLQALLPLCPPDIRVLAWVKGWASWKANASPKHAWEPVLLKRLRKAEPAYAVRDWWRGSATNGQGVPGAKPEGFCFWLFDAAGLDPADELVDVYPGSGAVGRAHEAWVRQRPFVGMGR